MEFVKYRSFHDQKLAEEFIGILKENNIRYEVSELKSNLDTLYTGSNPMDYEIEIRIDQVDFEKVNEFWEDDLKVDMNSIDENHYLFQFSDEELFAVLLRPDEWSPLDYKLSIEILRQRGKNLDEDLISSLKKQRLDDLSRPESSQVPWIIVGYFASFLGGLIGIGIGLHLMTSKKVLPDGRKIPTYIDSDRKQGKVIFGLGVFFLIFWVVFRTMVE